MKIDNSININSIVSSSERVKSQTQKEDNSFDRIFTRMTYGNNVKNLSSNSKQWESSSSKRLDYKDKNIADSKKIDDIDSKPVPKEIKEKLRESGMSEEEVDKINSLEDLKKMVEPDKLIGMLLSFMNLNLDSLDMTGLKGKIEEQIKGVVNSNIDQYGASIDELQLKNKVIDGLFSKVTGEEALTSLSSSSKNDDLMMKIQQELSAALKNSLDELKANEKDVKDGAADLKLISKNFNLYSENEVTNTIQQGDKASEESPFNSSSKGDDTFLKNLLSDNSDKITKVTNFMSQFNNIKVDNLNGTEAEKLVINKNTINTDIIKTLKFMQTNSMKDLTVKIMPKELGEVVISLTVEAGVMKATITAANKEAYNLLNSNLMDITNKLQNNDIKIQNLALNIYNEDTTFFKDGNGSNENGSNEQKGRRTNAIGAIGEDISENDNLSEVDSNVDMLA
ncbi:flagellar hook-length control protein FliK [Clostridium sp. CX1]|uniref:flagellar hook-length control protein FliK n=1 Tax=Clostridium sp. CX1 TaxID=2978346 RepID=UPI0021C0CCBA|nr:flagellar hook-length control protein FliK [Clostridium sp. CX1]MCT8976106.1 flagellar hook-length control protein FliK [Clostridium sp. CX1]